MLAILRAEQRNPASYLARLSRDVLDHYLVRQYTPLWLYEATCQMTWRRLNSQPVVRLDETCISVTLGSVTLGSVTFNFYSTGRVGLTIMISRGYGTGYHSDWSLFRQEVYVLEVYSHQLYVFTPTFQFIRQEERPTAFGLFLSSQGDLVEFVSQKESRVYTIISKQDLSRYIITVPHRAAVYACQFGLVYMWIYGEKSLTIYDGTSQVCFPMDPEVNLGLSVTATILAPGHIVLTNHLLEMTLSLT